MIVETKRHRRRLNITGGRLLPPDRRRRAMCDKCNEIDKAIERYRRILLSISDQLTVDRTRQLIADLQAQKAALHPRQQM
jgi:hypothetical protein